MSLLDCLTPQTVAVKGARRVTFGINEHSWEDTTKYKRLTPEQRKEYHKLKVRRHREQKRQCRTT